MLTRDARERMPDAVRTLFQGNREALRGFTQVEEEQLVDLLTRLIGNLDQIANTETMLRDVADRAASDHT